jgi:hypothetical protein
MMQAKLIGLSIMLLTLPGCVTFDALKDAADIVDSLPTDGALSCKEPSSRAVDFEPQMINPAVVKAALPGTLSSSPVTEKILKVFSTQANQSISRGANDGITKITFGKNSTLKNDLQITDGEIKDFLKEFSATVLDPPTYTGSHNTTELYSSRNSASTLATTDEQKRNLSYVFKKYYAAYIRGEYIDRTGTLLSKPEIKKNISNDVLSAILSIFLDALADTQTRTPIIKNGDKYYPGESTKVPTAITTGVIKPLDVSTTPENCGITVPEARAIGFLSNLAGDKSALLGGLILQSFQDVHLTFILGSSLSIGDNDTLATLVKSLLENVSRRAVERGAYEFFWAYSYKADTQRTPTTPPHFTYFDASAEARASGSSETEREKRLTQVANFLVDFE